ncbi:MAG: hypothetical protein BGO31_02980 [Bacteroidetes bacterium 43-16]|nr:MAG: hypothetical protein BGO31_02980 [Bacteroidetes bacterium 43-16]
MNNKIKIAEIVEKDKLNSLAISLQNLSVIKLSNAIFVNRYLDIQKYQTKNIEIRLPNKKISKII